VCFDGLVALLPDHRQPPRHPFSALALDTFPSLACRPRLMSLFADILADARDIDREISARFAKAAEDAATEGRAKALEVRRWQDRTDDTKDAIRASGETIDGGGEGMLVADSRNAVRLMEGTPPHDIRPVRAAALRFEVRGQTRFARVVHHPGTQPDGYMDAAGDEMERFLEEAVDRVMGDLLG